MDFNIHYNRFKALNFEESAMYQKIFPFIFLFIFPLAFSAQTSFQTTRLKSTGGAGVASILMDEATFLNPAPLAFFNLTAVLLQRTNGETSFESPGRRYCLHAPAYGACPKFTEDSVFLALSTLQREEGKYENDTIAFQVIEGYLNPSLKTR